MHEVNVIKPNHSLEQVLDTHDIATPTDQIRVIGLPKLISQHDVEIERKIFENCETTLSVTVDLLTGTCVKNDIYPEIESQSFNSTSLLNPRIDRQTAMETAHSYVRRQINTWYKSLKTPQITATNDETVFRLFWIVPSATPSIIHLIDTITGEITARNATIGEYLPNLSSK